MNREYQKEKVVDCMKGNIKSAIKIATNSTFTTIKMKEPRNTQIDKDLIKHMHDRRKYKNNNTRE